ncbi:hypothetical protein N9235_00195 [Gammaproteobacteria bacterium]|nr:hypothetical protein [Gammaproteobacteria bacterium]
MRVYILMLPVILMCAGNLYALSVDSENRPQNEKAANGQPQTLAPQPVEKNPLPLADENDATREAPPRTYQATEKTGKKAAPPVSTFTPTERISADSAVSFPVDI